MSPALSILMHGIYILVTFVAGIYVGQHLDKSQSMKRLEGLFEKIWRKN